MENVNIRAAEVKDAPQIATIHVKTWQSAYKGQIPGSYLESLSIEKRAESWEKQLEKMDLGVHALVAEVDGQVVGWCTVGKSRDEDVSKETGELHGIYVLPSYAGQGVGSKLIKQAMDILRVDGYKSATLWVLDTNKKTKKWYESRGWKVEGKTKTESREDFDLHETRYIIDLQ